MCERQKDLLPGKPDVAMNYLLKEIDVHNKYNS
jgi:hypothetical protein